MSFFFICAEIAKTNIFWNQNANKSICTGCLQSAESTINDNVNSSFSHVFLNLEIYINGISFLIVQK